jgi:hypothetical protein
MLCPPPMTATSKPISYFIFHISDGRKDINSNLPFYRERGRPVRPPASEAPAGGKVYRLKCSLLNECLRRQ